VRDKLRQRGYEQAKKFSWDASAQRILDVYKEVAGGARARAEVHSLT